MEIAIGDIAALIAIITAIGAVYGIFYRSAKREQYILEAVNSIIETQRDIASTNKSIQESLTAFQAATVSTQKRFEDALKRLERTSDAHIKENIEAHAKLFASRP